MGSETSATAPCALDRTAPVLFGHGFLARQRSISGGRRSRAAAPEKETPGACCGGLAVECSRRCHSGCCRRRYIYPRIQGAAHPLRPEKGRGGQCEFSRCVGFDKLGRAHSLPAYVAVSCAQGGLHVFSSARTQHPAHLPISSCGTAEDFNLHRAQGQHAAPESLVHGANGTRVKAYGDERSAQRKVVVRSVLPPPIPPGVKHL